MNDLGRVYFNFGFHAVVQDLGDAVLFRDETNTPRTMMKGNAAYSPPMTATEVTQRCKDYLAEQAAAIEKSIFFPMIDNFYEKLKERMPVPGRTPNADPIGMRDAEAVEKYERKVAKKLEKRNRVAKALAKQKGRALSSALCAVDNSMRPTGNGKY